MMVVVVVVIRPLNTDARLMALLAGNPYQDANGVFGDNQFRYALLSLAACEAPLQLHIGGFRWGAPPGFPYGDKVVFVANDWHAGLVPSYIAGKYRRAGVYKVHAVCSPCIPACLHSGLLCYGVTIVYITSTPNKCAHSKGRA